MPPPPEQLFLGIDAGSISLDAVVIDVSGRTLASVVLPTRGRTLECLSRALHELSGRLPDAIISSSCATGSGRTLFPGLFPCSTLNEITAHARGTGPYLPRDTPCSLLEIGGQDSKFLQLERRADQVEVQDYYMNTLCAAGTGTFFDGQAERLGLSIEEFSSLAAAAPRAAQVAGRCVVFAKTDIIHHQQRGTPLDELALGLCHTAAHNIIGTLIRGRPVRRPLFFTGGVAANQGMVRALREVLGLPDHLPLVPDDHRILGAMGAALSALSPDPLSPDPRACRGEPMKLSDIASRVPEPRIPELRPEPAEGPVEGPADMTTTRSWALDAAGTDSPTLTSSPGLALGLDLGSVSIKWVLVDGGRITDSFYAFTQGRPVQALARAMERLADSLGSGVRLDAIGVTGSGRKLAGRLLGADLVVNEITAQATAMRVLDPQVDTIFEIGGQDAKYVRLEGERIADFALNTACSAGTGSLLLEESVRLGLDVSELDVLADRSLNPLELHDRCTVFIDSDLVSRMQEGTANEDLAAGMLRAVARNYLDRVVSHRSPGEHIVFAGGVSRSPTVRRELERILGRPVAASPWGALSGAIGAALMALERSSSTHDVSELTVPLSPRSVRTIRCHGCGGTCSVTRLDFEATERKPAVRLFSGDACGRWGERTDSGPDPESRRDVPPDDLFEERARLYGMDTGSASLTSGQVGIPRAQQFWDVYPMMRTFLDGLGLEAGLSSTTTRATIQGGITLSRTEQCMPVKVALAHAAELLEKGCSALLVPTVGEYPQEENLTNPESERLLPCIYTMQLGSVIQSTLGTLARESGIPIIVPSLNFKPELESYTCRSLQAALEPLGRFSGRRIRSAFRAAHQYHQALRETSESLGLEVLRSASPENPAVVIFGRPYTIYDPVLNIQLIERLRRLGLTPIPFDTILRAGKVQDHFSFMQWKMGSDHLRAAQAMVPFQDAHPLFLTYYGCGPDAFISKYFPEILGDRPSLALEFDGHSAEAGLETRLEAFADAIRSARRRKRTPEPPPRLARDPSLMRGRTVALPYFADTVHAFAGALERAGMQAHIMPLADNETRLLGERFSDGRECNPHAIMLGDLVRWARDPRLPNHEKGFFITAARGPCLLTHYAQSYARVLRKLDAEDILVWNPYGTEILEILSISDLRCLWHGILATDYIFRWCCALHPYETSPGSADLARSQALDLIRRGIRAGDVISSTREAVSIMGSVPNNRSDPEARSSRIKVGIIGDLYTRIHPFANQNLYQTLENLGCEVLAPPFLLDGQLYDLWDHPHQYFMHGQYSRATRRALLSLYQLEEAWRIRRLFPQDPEITYDSPGWTRQRITADYFASDVDGYLAQNLGKGIDFIEIGAEGILNVMCHNCMVGLTSDAVFPEVRSDHHDVPFFSLAYDSLGDVHVGTRLEAFVDLLRNRRYNVR